MDDGHIVVAALAAGNVLLMVQPPRGFGENPVAIYHDPDLPPSHHYLGAYRYLAAPRAEGGFGADAIVHLGKHGNLEWLPGKTMGMSASCGTDAALGDLPLVYPFLVNDPGEGTQAKRRAHATLVDHLIPPMARAETYGDIARLEQLLDEHANIAALDPAKLPAIRQQIWTLMQAARMDHDLGLADRPDEDVFDEMLLHVDGWLCEIKDVQIRDGLHVLGAAPTGEVRVDLVLAMLRARQMWGGEVNLPGLREALGLVEDAPKADVDAAEERARALVAAMEAAGWDPDAATTVAVAAVADRAFATGRTWPTRAEPRRSRRSRGGSRGQPSRGGAQLPTDVERVLRFAATEVVPRLAGTAEELSRVLHALDGGFVPAGPVGLAAARADQRAAHRPQLLLRRPEGGAVAAGVGDRAGHGRVAGRALPRRSRRAPAQRGAVGVGHQRDAHLRRRRGRGAGAARRAPGVGRGQPPRHHPRGDHPRRARPPPHRRHRAHLGLLPRRLPARAGPARRRSAARRGPGRARRPELRAGPRRRRDARSGSSGRSRAPTGPGSCS